jgi:hypothetical protein
MTEPYDVWRVELETALDEARAELEVAVAAHEQALFAVRHANAEKVALARAFSQLGSRQVAGSLMQRRRGYETGLDQAASALTRATNAVASLRRQIADIEQALEQLSQISPPSEDTSDDEAA